MYTSLLFLVCSSRRSADVVCHSHGHHHSVCHPHPAGRVSWSGRRREACGRANPDPQNLPPDTSGLCPSLQSWSRTVVGLCVSAAVCALEWAGTPGPAHQTLPTHWALQTGSPHPASRSAPHLLAVSHSARSPPSHQRYSAGLSHAAGWRTGRCRHDDGWQVYGP